MLKQRLSAAHEVRAVFLEAERSQDEAAIRAAHCLTTALEQRRAANLPATTGIEALENMARAVHLAVQARNELALAHPKLAALPKEMGIERAFGDDGNCPGLTLTPGLQVVAAA